MSGTDDGSKVTGRHRVPFKKRSSTTSRRIVAVTDAMIEAERAKVKRAVSTSRRMRAVSPEVLEVDESLSLDELLADDAPDWVLEGSGAHIDDEPANYLLAGAKLGDQRKERMRGSRQQVLSQVSATSGWVGRWIKKLGGRGGVDEDT